jgi:hypothetical protein
VQGALNEMLDRAWGSTTASELWKLVPRDEFLSVACDVTPLTLTKVRRLAFRLGVRVTDLLSGSAKEAPGVLDPTWTSPLPKVMRPKKRVPRHDLHRLRIALDAAVRRSRGSFPPSLRKVAQELSVTGGCIRHHFPVHANELLLRFDSWRKRESARKLKEAQSAAARFVASASEPSELTAKGALRLLRRETKLPKDLLRREIARALDLRLLAVPPLHFDSTPKETAHDP